MNTMIPDNLKYITTHQWLRLEADGTATVGITDHAQQQLGDIVYVALPVVGSHITTEVAVSTVESVKSASDVFSPVSGQVIAINETLADSPELVNNAPYDDGWFFRIKPSSTVLSDSLLDAKDYAQEIGAK